MIKRYLLHIDKINKNDRYKIDKKEEKRLKVEK